MVLVDRRRERLRLVQVRRGGLAPDEVGVRRVREPAGDGRVEAVAHAEEPLGRALAGAELAIGLVDVRREQRGRERVRARHDQGRHVEDVGGESRGHEGADELARRHEHLAAQVTALLLRRELVLEVDRSCAGLDVGLHDLERVQRPAETGLRVGDDRREPVRLAVALRVADLVGAEQRVRDPPGESGARVRRIEALVRIGAADEVGVCRNLPAREVDRLEARLHHLHRLAARHGAEGRDPLALGEEHAEPLGAEARERVLDPHRAAQTLDVVGGVGAKQGFGHRHLLFGSST